MSGSALKGKVSAAFTKDTFWNRLRLAKGVTLTNMAQEIGIDQSWLSRCLTGSLIPSTPIAIKICDYFNVDYAEGAAEFNKAHEAWVQAHQGETKKRSPIRKRKFDVEKVPALAEKAVKKSAKAKNDLVDNVIRKLYGNISFDDFMTIALCEPTTKDLLEFAYNKVDVDTFMELLSASKT